MTYQELLESGREYRRAVWEAEKQQYQQEYESGEQILPWGLKGFLNALPDLTKKVGEALTELLKLKGDMRAVQQRNPDACPAIVELIARALKLSPHAVEAALGLPPPAQDALDTLLLDVMRGLAPEVRNGTLPLTRIVAAVNADRSEHEALLPVLLASRLRALGFPFTRHHPTSVILLSSLLPPLVPSPEEPCARENDSNIQ